jgi:hypothetical protein
VSRNRQPPFALVSPGLPIISRDSPHELNAKSTPEPQPFGQSNQNGTLRNALAKPIHEPSPGWSVAAYRSVQPMP